MNSYLRFAGAAGLCAALLLAACAKKTDQTTTSTDTSQSATTSATDMPIASDSGSPSATATTSAMSTATAAPAASGTPSTMTVTTTTTSSNGSTAGAFITLPIYPGAAEKKDQALSGSSNNTTVVMHVYTTKDDAKTVSEWYKSHLPASWKSNILTAGDKTVGTFDDEHPDGDQSVIVGADNDGTTRIQLTTKHGK